MLLCAFLTFIIYRLVDLHKFLLKSIYTALCLSRSQSVMFCLSPEGQTFLSHRRGGDKHFSHTGGDKHFLEVVEAMMMLMKRWMGAKKTFL